MDTDKVKGEDLFGKVKSKVKGNFFFVHRWILMDTDKVKGEVLFGKVKSVYHEGHGGHGEVKSNGDCVFLDLKSVSIPLICGRWG